MKKIPTTPPHQQEHPPTYLGGGNNFFTTPHTNIHPEKKDKIIHHFVQTYLSQILILWNTQKPKYICTIIGTIFLYGWYTKICITTQIHTISLSTTIFNIIMIAATLKAIRYILLSNKNTHNTTRRNNIFLLEHQEFTCSLITSTIFAQNIIVFACTHTNNTSPTVTKYIVPCNNILSLLSNCIMLIIIAQALKQGIDQALKKEHKPTSYHQAIKKIKKLPKFAQQYAVDYYIKK